MNKRNYGLYAIALAIIAVGALALGVPPSSLVFLAVALACPLMMLFMMRGMHDAGTHDHNRADRDEGPSPSSSSRGGPIRKHDHHTGPGRA